ncbi:MAG TPA: DUF3999 family protein, partial [Thermoanaerobaculia bacterium]|nr:DUF3999 family protein [Thermoanaerobaculia bacterium]
MIAAILLAAIARTIVTHPGANRLDPDVALLSGTASPLRNGQGLDDLRLRDGAGHEVQYLLIAPPSSERKWRGARSILAIPQTKTTSGIEADLGTATAIDRIKVEGISPPFMKRLRVDGSGDRLRWSVLSAETTLFDLPDQQLKNLELAIPAGEYRYIRLVWDDRSSARVSDALRISARLSERAPAPQLVAIEIPFRKISSEPGTSRYRLALPGPHLPAAAIELRVANGNVDRNASVSEPRFNGSELVPVALGTAKLRRAERDGTVAENMSIPISPPAGADLEVAVDDGNSGPLNIKTVVARFAPLPWIYFETNADAITATYGDVSLHAPHYDLEASRRVVEKLQPPQAAWSSSGNPPPPETAPAPALPIEGAPIDRSGYRRSRAIGPVARGLASLLLDADVQAHSDCICGVRLADASNRQVPYIVERRDAPMVIAISIPPRTVSGTSSIYRFNLPYDRFPEGTKLTLTTNARVFERDVQLRRPADESRGRDSELLGETTWRSADPDSSAPALTFAPRLTTRSVELRIDERDNAPLPITTAKLLLPSYALRFFGNGSPLTLLYDNPSASAPQYDLALLAPRLLSEPVREIALPAVGAPSPPQSAQKERTVFWSVIGIATLALLVTLGRLLKDEQV